MNAVGMANQRVRSVVASRVAGEGNGHEVCIESNCPCRTLRSGRHRQVLHCLMHGLSEKETASSMGTSTNTVHSHVSAIYRRFAVRSRAALLARMLAMVMGEGAEDVRVARASADAAETSRGLCEYSLTSSLRRRA